MVMMFPLSRYNEFCKKWRDGDYPFLRLGQAFHHYMELGKITSTNEKEFCDRLWAVDNEKACDMIASRIDDNC